MSINALIKSVNSSKKFNKEYFIHGNILVFLQDPLPEDVDIKNVCRNVQKIIPKKFFKDLDYIYIGKFPELETRNLQSAYLRGAIYITNIDQSEESLISAIVHELAHSVEEVYKETIYGDSELAAEFVGKRKKLRSLLKTQNIEFENPSVFLRIEYNHQFDEFLYNLVGYDMLTQLCVGLFASPYGATSLREYFANGFEHYYIHDRDYIRKISPKLFSVIYKLTKKGVWCILSIIGD